MKRIITIFSKSVLALTLLSVFAWSVLYVNDKGNKQNALGNAFKEFTLFPDLVLSVFSEIKKPERLLAIDTSFDALNNLNYNLYALNASFEASKWIIGLTNLKSDSSIYEWYFNEEDYNFTKREFSHAEPRMPILLSDTSIIVHNDESHNIYRLDANSNIVWHNTDHQFHHSINLDSAGNIWACTKERAFLEEQDIKYWDNYLTKLDVQTGEVVYQKSLTKVFIENNMGHVIHGYNNLVPNKGHDPLHLNEIEPVLKSGPFWNEGDLFISLRNRSMVFLYRPSTNKIMKVLQGPFFNQHDIDILSDSTISIFNNNASSLVSARGNQKNSTVKNDLLPNAALNINAQVLVYNFNSSTYSSIYPEEFEKNNVYTRVQGLHHILQNGDLFVDCYQEGKVYIFKTDETVLRKYYNTPKDGLVENTHWVRIYENLDILNP